MEMLLLISVKFFLPIRRKAYGSVKDFILKQFSEMLSLSQSNFFVKLLQGKEVSIHPTVPQAQPKNQGNYL